MKCIRYLAVTVCNLQAGLRATLMDLVPRSAPVHSLTTEVRVNVYGS